MALLDFIEVSDDVEIINLISDEEDVAESHNASAHSNSAQHQATLHDVQAVFAAEVEGREEVSAQHQATLHDVQAVFAAEGEGREEVSAQHQAILHDVQAVFAAEGEGREEVSAQHQATLHDVQAVFAAEGEGREEVSAHHQATLHDVQAVFAAEGEGREEVSAHHQATLHDVQAVFAAEGEGREEVSESGNLEEATASSSITEKESGNPEEATASQTCAHTPTAVTFPGPSSISPKALTFEACGAKPARVKAKRRRKLFHADTPWRSPRLEGKHKGRKRSMEEVAVEFKISRMLYEEENTSAGRSRRKSKLVGTQCGICGESPPIPQN